MLYCNFTSIWYGTIWIPSLLYLCLGIIVPCKKNIRFLSKQFYCYTSLLLSSFLRIIWFFEFTGCVNLYPHLTSNILLRFPQLSWLNLYTTLMLTWDTRLNSTIIGDNVNKFIHIFTIIITLLANVIVTVLIFLEEFIANNIFFMVWTTLLLIAGIYLGLSTINILKQLMPLETNQNDNRNILLRKTKKILAATTLATILLLLCNLIRYVDHWVQGQAEYLFFVLIIHLICEPILVFTQYYAFFF